MKLKHLVKRFSYGEIYKELDRHGWRLPTADEVRRDIEKHGKPDYDCCWVSDLPPLEEDWATHASLYNVKSDSVVTCNKSFMQPIVVIQDAIPDDCELQYISVAQAYYREQLGNNKIEELQIGTYYKEGGLFGEFTITWEYLDGKYVPKLNAWDDGWLVLVRHYRELLEYMATIDDENLSPKFIINKLEEMGVRDCTPREHVAR